MINIKGHIKLSFENKFAIIPQLGHQTEWKPISQIKKHDACWLQTRSNFPISFGIANSILVTSEPITNEDYMEFDFVDFM